MIGSLWDPDHEEEESRDKTDNSPPDLIMA